MNKLHLFEFEDFKWFPNSIRESMTDYLRYFLTATDFYRPITPLIAEGLEKTGRNKVIDLCSGSGGPMQKIQQNIESHFKRDVEIVLTDKFPNVSAYEFLKSKSKGRIGYSRFSVDATNVPSDLAGFRTVFSGIHHFDPQTAKAVIRNAVDSQEGIGIFDGGDRNIFTILGIIIFHPVAFFFLTPFFRPYRLSRFIFTYLVPIIPFCTVWDGVVSIIRLYKPEELLKMARDVDSENYYWKSGKIKNKYNMNVAYLVGYPKHKHNDGIKD